MPNYRRTFPTLTKSDRATLDLHLASMTKVQRPALVDLLMGGLNAADIVSEPGKIPNDAWKALNPIQVSYSDESERSRREGGSQTETIRAACKKIAVAFESAFGDEYPSPVGDAFMLTALEGGANIWRLR